jgi:hypothetical protein
MTREKKNLFHQRKKGEPITYDGSVKPIRRPFGKQKGSGLSDKLTLKIKASPQDWHTLYLLAKADPEYLGRLVLIHITRPVYEQFLSREGIHLSGGLHNVEQQLFMEKARSYAAAAYAVLSHWAKSPLATWPDDLKAIIREAENKLTKESIWPPTREIEKTLGKESTWPPPRKKKLPEKSIDVIAVVRYLINSKYGRRGDELGLGNVEHMDNEIFRKIYFDKNKLKAAVALLNDFIQNYGDSLTIDELYDDVPKFGWE